MATYLLCIHKTGTYSFWNKKSNKQRKYFSSCYMYYCSCSYFEFSLDLFGIYLRLFFIIVNLNICANNNDSNAIILLVSIILRILKHYFIIK